MAKVMLVEDDNNLREIYEARLAAEGYEIISAPDGEAALALAIKEKPDLIISDIMMPKVSGFDMLDILRSTTETKHAKIIMMTALNQAEDKAKAEQLGADLYLVKSQVTLEDVVKSAQQLLGDQNPATVSGITIESPSQAPVPMPQPPATSLTSNTQTVPVQINPQPAPVPPQAAAAPVAPPAPTPQTQSAPATNPTSMLTAPPSTTPTDPTVTALPEDKPAGEQITVKNGAAAAAAGGSESYIDPSISGRKKVIKPISDVLTKGPNLNALLEEEKAESPALQPSANSVISPSGVTVTPPPQDVMPASPQPQSISTTPTQIISPQQLEKPQQNQTVATQSAPGAIPTAPSTEQEEAALQAQIEQFISQAPTTTSTPQPAQTSSQPAPTPQQPSNPLPPVAPPAA